MSRLIPAIAVGVVASVSTEVSLANEIDFEQTVPVVLTPTRLRQALSDAPASVSVITSEMISSYGIGTIPDALRLVPGMAVSQVTGNDYRVNYHGTNILVPRRMNVLIDGVPVYGLRITGVDWTLLPVAIEDIERIEVIRGSNSAAYGSNSMLAIINIITKHPNEVEGETISARVGTGNSAAGFFRKGGRIGDSTSFRLSYDRENEGGFDYASSMKAGRDSRRINRLNWRSLTEINASETLDLQASVVQGTLETEFVDSSQKTFPDIEEYKFFINAAWKKSISQNHDVRVQADLISGKNSQLWRSCLPAAYLLPAVAALGRANSSYVRTVLAGKKPSGGSSRDDQLAAGALLAIKSLGTSARNSICLDANQDYDQHRIDLELEDTFVFSDSIRMVNGIGFRYDNVTSQTYFNGTVNNNTFRVFTNVEYKPSEKMTLNVGGFLERDELTGGGFSPRIALNTHINENNTIRFVVSKAVRMPDLLEQRANWTYRTTNYSSPVNGATEGYFAFTAISPRNLQGERITSKEIGYLGNFPKYGALVDVKIFDDELSYLISEKLQNSDFSPTNSNWAHLKGAEFQVTYNPTKNWGVHLAYSHLHNKSSNIFETTQYAPNSGAIGVTHLTNNGWRYSLAIYQYGAKADGESFYGREDLTISKSYRLNRDQTITPAFTITHLDNRSSTFLVDNARIRESRYDSSMQYFAALKITF